MLAFENILIVGAHYDDSELGAGGTAARLINEGHKVYKITLTDTVVKSADMGLDITNDRVRENSKNACYALGGVEEINFSTQPYGNLKYTQECMQEMEHIIYERNIDTVFMHFADDYNTDHLEAHKICKTAARHVKNLLMYQSNPYIIYEHFCPNYYIDISSTVDKKKAVLACYDAEHDRWGHLFNTNIQRNEIWGYGNHVKCAEGFCAIKTFV